MTTGDGLIEVRGVIAMNGQGEVCFFAHSQDEGLPILGDDGRAMTSNMPHLARAVRNAPPRRVTYPTLWRLDPPEGFTRLPPLMERPPAVGGSFGEVT
jgi:hypothetical protein